jgi:cholesterol oxidase
MDYDYIIIGSGFGGSVSALRLAEKGYRVAVLEQGRRVSPDDMTAAARSLSRLFWLPGLGMKGFFSQRIFRHVGVVGGVGVGGGSLVYAAVLLEPKPVFFAEPTWSGLGIDWQTELTPYHETAKRMLGRTTHPPRYTQMDHWLRATADEMGAGETFGRVPLGIYFGETTPQPDPFFAGRGPERAGCRFCGECLTGCRYGSKNSLDLNYLHLAESLGATILPERRVTGIRPLADGGYQVDMVNLVRSRKAYPALTGRKVIVAAGVLGTLELLFRCRDVLKTLPNVSQQLGRIVRTNSEAIVGIIAPEGTEDLSQGVTISTDFYPDAHTHITQNRFPAGYTFMKWQSGPLVDDPRPARRTLKSLAAFLRHPLHSTLSWRTRNWHRRISVLTVMQHLDNQIVFRYRRGGLTLGRRGLQSQIIPGKRAPTYLPVANDAARTFAHLSGGEPLNVLLESLIDLSFTAHILGGCHMGRSVEDGVIGTDHQVFGYPGLYVIDGAAISANVGVNPSLTISALAERAMSLIPSR